MVNVLVHLLEHLSFRLRCPSFLLSKICFTIKVNSICGGILGICVTSSILRVLLSGFWVSWSQVPSPRDSVQGSGSQFQGPGCQGPVCQGPVSPGSQSLRVPDPRVLGPGSQSSGSRVSGPYFRLCQKEKLFFCINSFFL